MATTASLWPKEIETRREKAPVAILREQASILGEKTRNLVQGEVSTSKSVNNQFAYDFYIVSPPLENYHFKLMTVSHGINFYPLQVDIDQDIHSEIFGEGQYAEYPHIYGRAESEKQFLDLLKQIFGAEKTVRVITSLLSQADPDWDAKGDWPPPENPFSEENEEDDDIPF